MALAVVQTQHYTNNVGTASPLVATFPSSVTAGNFLVAVITAYALGTPAPATQTVTDNKGNTWVRDYYTPTSTGGWSAFYSTRVTTGGATFTVTATDTNATNTYVGNMDIVEVSGVSTTTPFDKSAFNTATSDTYTTGSTGTLTQADEIAFISVGPDTGSTATITEAAGWTSIGQNLDASWCVGDAGYRIVSATTAINHAWTTTIPPCVWAAGIATYRAVASVVPTLVVADGGHGHTADNLTLGYTPPTTTLVTADGAHAHAAANVTLTTGLVLAIDSAAHGHVADNVSLAAGFQTQSATHGHVADNVALPYSLTIQSANHGHIAGNVSLALLRYPVSVSNRKFLDQNGNVFLVKDISSWGMGANLTNAEITQALNGIAARHFNVIVAGIGLHGLGGWGDGRTQVATGQPFWTGTPWASSLGPGWASFDWLIAECTRLGMTLAFSFEIMTATAGMEEDLNAVTLTQAYNSGVAIATRWAGVPNLMWHIEHESYPNATSGTGQRLDQIFHGIRDTEGANPRLIIIEPYLSGNGYDAFISQQLDHGFPGGYQWLKISANSLYQYTADSVVQFDIEWTHTGATTYPVWDCEPPYSGAGHYDGNQSQAPGQVERQNMRERNFAVLIRGGVGINWGHEMWWPFGNQGLFNVAGITWQMVPTQPETFDAQYCWDIVDLYCTDLTWAPDNTPLVNGLGSGDTKAAVGRSTNAFMAYFSNSRIVTINTTLIGGSNPIRIRWYDPTTGVYTTVASGEVRGANRGVTYPSGTHADGSNDWVLVVDDRSALSVDNAIHAHFADNLTLTGPAPTNLVVNGAVHGHTADSPTLVFNPPVYTVVTDSTVHGHVADSPLLSLPNSTSLVTASCVHGHLAANVVIVITALLKLRVGTTVPTRLYVGATSVTKAYIGATQVWP